MILRIGARYGGVVPQGVLTEYDVNFRVLMSFGLFILG